MKDEISSNHFIMVEIDFFFNRPCHTAETDGRRTHDRMFPPVASVAPTGEPCRTPEQYRLAIEKEQDLLFYGGWSHVKCNCLKQCNEDIYSTYTEAAKTSGKSAKLRVFFQVIKGESDLRGA